MTSEATKMAVRSNMHMNTRVIEIPHFNAEAKFEAIEAVKSP